MQNCSHIKDDIEGNDMLLIVSVSINMILLIVNIGFLYDKFVYKVPLIQEPPPLPPPYISDV
jgi:hypothetical protein